MLIRMRMIVKENGVDLLDRLTPPVGLCDYAEPKQKSQRIETRWLICVSVDYVINDGFDNAGGDLGEHCVSVDLAPFIAVVMGQAAY